MSAPTRDAATRALDHLAAFGKAGDMAACRVVLVASGAMPEAAVSDLSDSAVKFVVAGILIGASFAAASLDPNPDRLHWTDCAERPV